MGTNRSILDRIGGKSRAIWNSKMLIRVRRPRWAYLVSHRTQPVSPLVGIDRGTPIDRYFIERFLERHAADFKGDVIEIKDREYTQRFGGSRVTRSEILDVNRENTMATMFDDIRTLASIPDKSVDCFIITQVLQYVDDLDAAARSIRRVLKVGGSALITVPTVGKLDGHEDKVAGHYWRLTSDSSRYIFSRTFAKDELQIESWGNARVGLSFLAGLAAEDLTQRELETHDPLYACGVCIRATRLRE